MNILVHKMILWFELAVHLRLNFINRYVISNNVVCATNKGSDQLAHTRKLIRAFAGRLNILWLLNYWPNFIWGFWAY